MSTNFVYGHFVVIDFGCYRVHGILNRSLGGVMINFLEICVGKHVPPDGR